MHILVIDDEKPLADTLCHQSSESVPDVQEEQYGLERLVGLVRANQSRSAAGIVDTVLAEVDQFSTGADIVDDRVLLTFKVI